MSKQNPNVEPDSGGHVAAQHIECDSSNCIVCDGGLFICIKCNSAEGATTSECPGEGMTADQCDAVYAGKLDYRGGKYREEASRYSPTGFARYIDALKSGMVKEQERPGVRTTIEMMGACPPGEYYFHAIPCICKEG